MQTVPVRFTEVQKFRQWWLIVLLGGIGLTSIGAFAWGLYQQLVLGIPWGDRPLSNQGLMWLAGGTILFWTIILWGFFFVMKLTTEVREDHLLLHFKPFKKRRVPFSTITSCAARTYRPIREYGGWGIKRGFSGWVYNVSGNRGVQLVLEDDEKLLVGSQKADQLEAAILSAMAG